MPLDLLLDAAIKHAREGYTVTRSQARLTAEKFAELEDARRVSSRLFWSMARRPRRARSSSKAPSPPRSTNLAHAGLDDFYRGDVGREIAADLERIGSPVTRADLEKYRARIAEPLTPYDPTPARSITRRRRRKAWPRS